MSELKIYNNTEFIKDVIKDVLDIYSNLKDVLTDEILENQAVELLGDCSSIAKFFIKSKKIIDMGMFKFFLKGFYIDEEPEQERLEKLIEYIDNEDKAMFIGKTVENILNYKSRYASFILGYIINTLIIDKEELNPKYVILADALTHMFDHDIKNIRFIGDYCNYKIYDERTDEVIKQRREVCFYKKFIDILDKENIDKDIFFLTLEKCISYQIMVKNIDSSTELDLDGIDITYHKQFDDIPEISTGMASADTNIDESYGTTVVGDLLYEILIKVGIK